MRTSYYFLLPSSEGQTRRLKRNSVAETEQKVINFFSEKKSIETKDNKNFKLVFKPQKSNFLQIVAFFCQVVILFRE